MEKQNKAKFSKEKKLKITAALLVALSGILAGIVELFSNCGCCCVNVVDCEICHVKIALLVVNVVAVLTALAADIIGIIEYGKHDYDVICSDCPYSPKYKDCSEYHTDDDSKDKTLKIIAETQPSTDKPKKESTGDGNKIFMFSLISTAVSVFLLCVSVVVLAVI